MKLEHRFIRLRPLHIAGSLAIFFLVAIGAAREPGTAEPPADASTVGAGGAAGTVAGAGTTGTASGDPALAKATFAGGCFWCMEPPFDALPGVVSTTSGYAGGRKKNPTYEEVSSGATGHTEAVQIVYDPRRIGYSELLQVFWHNVDPTDARGQFCDKGSQYRTAIFYHDDTQKKLAEETQAALDASKQLPAPIVTELVRAEEFWPAEEYHQDYYRKNPVRYKFYRYNCGRDARLAELWGERGNDLRPCGRSGFDWHVCRFLPPGVAGTAGATRGLRRKAVAVARATPFAGVTPAHESHRRAHPAAFRRSLSSLISRIRGRSSRRDRNRTRARQNNELSSPDDRRGPTAASPLGEAPATRRIACPPFLLPCLAGRGETAPRAWAFRAMEEGQALADLVLVDGDGHTVEPKDLWVTRMDARKWGDWIPRYVIEGEIETLYVGGVCRAGGRELTEKLAAEFGMTLAEWRQLLDSLDRPGGYEPDARIQDLDIEGIQAAVVYPTMSLFYGPVDEIEALHNADFVLDCQRAYNDWVAEFCAAYPKRLFGIAAVPLQDVEAAVREAERAVGRLGLKGVFIRPSPYVDELPLSHPVYDRFWAACQDLDVPVGLHPGVHVDTPGACRKFRLVQIDANTMVTNQMVSPLHGGSALGQAIGNTVDMIVSMGRLIMGGVCERFPRLRFIFLESGGGWVATQLERMDEQVKAFPLERHWLSLLPSEYFRRQCYVSFEPGEWNLAASAQFIGSDRILWASDYPHPDIDFPGAARELLSSIAPLPEADRRRVAGENAIRAYKLAL